MSLIKRRLEAKEAANAEALSFLIEIGALEECEDHPGTYVEGDTDLTEAYERVKAAIDNGQITRERGEIFRKVTDRLKAVYEDSCALDGCPSCDRNRRDD